MFVRLCITIFLVLSMPLHAVQICLDLSLLQVQQLDMLFPPFVFVEKLKFISDIAIDHQELKDLLSVSEGNLVTRDDIKRGVGFLAKKGKFKHICFETIKSPKGIELTIKLESFWTFMRLQLRGSLIGKDRYRHLYALEPGDIFDPDKHASSLRKIQKALAADGYYAAQLVDALSYDKTIKSVVVTIDIQQKTRFVIDNIQVSLEEQEGVCSLDGELVIEQARQLLMQMLCGIAYSKEVVEQATKQVQDFFVDQGFLQSSIQLEHALNRESCAVQLIFSVTLKHRNQFEFRGNNFFSRRKLIEQIMLFGKSAVLIPPSLIAEELIAFYKKEGFWNIEITWQDDGERVFFFIREGKRIAVSSVKLNGVKSLVHDELIKKHFKKLIAAEYFKGDLLQQALEALGQEYLEQGFWDFSIIGYEYVQQQKDCYELVVDLREGERRWLAGVDVEPGLGLEHLVNIQRYMNIVCPKPFDIRIVQKMRQEIVNSLKESGRLYVRPRPEFVVTPLGLRIIWKCDGSLDIVHFGDTVVVGTGRLPAYIVLREIAYQKGDVWNQHKIERSVLNLKQLGIFDVVSLAPDDISTQDPHKTMLLKYVEDSPYEARARLGMQGVNSNIVKFNAKGISYKAGGSFLVKNPANIGDILRFDLDFSRYMHSVAASYRIPWLFNQPIRTEFKGYSERYDQPIVIGSPEVLYRAAQDGFLIGMSRQYSHIDVGLNLGCESMGIKPGVPSQAAELSRAIQLDPRLIGTKKPYIFIEPTLFRSTLDNKIQPTRGYLSLISLKGMMPPHLPSAAFLKVMVEQSVFLPLPRWSWVLALRGRCGTIVNADFRRILPIERFFLGGAYSVRAYEPDLAPPLNPFCDLQGKKHWVPTGGRSLVNINTELRFPLYGSLSGVLFTDFGALSDKGVAAFRRDNVVGATGFGLRINTAVGPIRFDIGWKLRHSPHLQGAPLERSFAWFLVLGNPF